MPGLALTAALTAPTLISASLAMPGLDITARPTISSFVSTTLAMPGLAVAATLDPYTYLSATLAVPGLSVSAAAIDTRDVAATLAMPGLDVPRAIVSGVGPAATLAMPGLAVPTATVVNIAPTILRATLTMPGLSVAAAVTPPVGQFRLAPTYGLDWVKLQNLVPPSVVQIGAPVVTGVRMSGKPTGPESAGNVALVSKNKSGPGWTGAFTLKRTDAFAPISGGGSAFLILYFGAVGDGTSPPLSGFFVDPVNGSDANTGTMAAPWLTIAKAQTGRVAGDVVYLRGGSYRVPTGVTLATSGTAGAPITYKAYPGEAPVINACLAAYETAGNSAWEVDPGAPVGVNSYRTVATLTSDIYRANLQYNGVSYALNEYASLAWLRSVTYTYSTNPSGYYRGPGFFWNSADGKLYIRLDSLTGARAVDLDQGNGAIPPGFDFDIPSSPDPRLYAINISRFVDTLVVNGSNIVWDGIEVRGGHRSFVVGGNFVTVQNARVIDAQVTCNVSGNNHDILFLQCSRLDSGFFSPWASWAEIKTSPVSAADQKRSLCTQSGNSFNIEFRQCRLGRYFDGFTASGHDLKIINCDAEYILDDGMQCDTDAYNVWFCRNYWRGPILTNNGPNPQTVNINSKYVIGNIIDNTRHLPGYLPEFYCRTSHPSAASHTTWRYAHDTVLSHTDPSNTGTNPKTYAQNTVIYALNDNADGCGFQRECRGSGVHEVYNNIIVARDKTKGLKGGDTRDGGEFRNGNVYWRQGSPALEDLFVGLYSTGALNASYHTLALWKASAPGIASGWEALSIEADPLLVDLPNHDFRLQALSPARTGFVDLSAKTWLYLEPGTHAGAVAPGAVDPLGICGATFFRAAPAAVPARAPVGPYPASTVYDPLVLTGNATSYGVNADQWPTTTYLNGNVCAAWGDGNGFNNDQPRSSLGISEITGTPPATLTGVDKYLSGIAVDNRKPNAILHIGSLAANNIILLYANQTKDARVGTWPAISTNNGTTWTFHELAGERLFSTGATPPLQAIGAVQLGPAYDPQSSGLDANYAYFYLNNLGNAVNPFTGTNGNVWMCRVKLGGTGGAVANLWNPAKYSFFNGLSGGNPTWTADGGSLDTTKTVAVFPGGMGKHFLCGWSEVNNRFFAALTPTAGTVAIYEAPTPWGPWGTLYYGPGSDSTWTGIFTASLPGPWQTTSKLWLAVSGAPPDSLDVQSSPLSLSSVAAYPADIAQWDPTTEPVTTTFASHITGARLTFFFNNFALGVDPPPSVPALALFRADGSVTQIAADLVSGSPPAGLRQDRNFPFDYTAALSTASPPVLTLTQHDAGPPVTDRTITWTSALLGTLASPPLGSYIWLCTPGRVVEITAESFVPPGAGVPPSATLAMPGLFVSAQVDSVGVGTGWPNGYANRRTFAIPPQDDLTADTLGDFIVTVDTAKLSGQVWTWLATEFLSVVGAAPNKVPNDLRLTTTASPEVKIEHWVVLFTPDTSPPRLVWKMRIPGAGLVVGPAGVTFPFRLYSGKAGLATSEEQVAGVFAGVLAARVWPSGSDISGHGRHLTPSGVTAGTVDGLPGGVFGSASYARLNNPTWLDGVGGSAPGAGLTEEIMLLLANATGGNLWRAGGTPLQPPPLNHNARASSFLNASDAMQPGWNPADAAGTQVNNAVAGAANSAVVGETHLWHFVRSSGANCHLYMDETEQPSTYVGGGSPTATGSIQTVVGDVEGYGAGTGAQTTAVIGTYGVALLWPKVLGPSWVAVSARSQLTPDRLVGTGGIDLSADAVTSPVAVPLRRTLVGQTDIDVAALAYDDQSPRSVTLISASADLDGNSTVTTPGGKVRVNPNAGVVSVPSRIDYTVGKGAKRSTARLFLTVTGSVIVPGGGEGLAPDFPASAVVLGPVALGGLQAAYNALLPTDIAKGVTILVTPGGSLSGTLSFNTNGASASKPIVIRVGTLSGGRIVDPGSFPAATVSGAITIGGNHNWVRGFRSGGASTISAGTTDGRFNRCLFSGVNARCTDDGVSSIWDWCEFTGSDSVHLNPHPKNGNRDLWVYRCYFHDPFGGSVDGNVFLCIGNGVSDQFNADGTQYDANPVVQDTHFFNFGSTGSVKDYANSAEFKCNNGKLLRCSQMTGTGSRPARMVYRHGDRGTFQACHIGDGNLTMRGIGHTLADSHSTPGNVQVGPSGGNNTASAWSAYCAANHTQPTNNYQNAEGAVIAGMDSAFQIGYDPSAHDAVAPTGTIVENDIPSGLIGLEKPSITYTRRPRQIQVYRETPGGPIKTYRMWTPGVDVGPNGGYDPAQ